MSLLTMSSGGEKAYLCWYGSSFNYKKYISADFGSVLRLHKLIPLEECAELHVHQEMKPCMLVLVTKQKKWQIEQDLEYHFDELMGREVTLSAELIEGYTDKYKITIEQEGG